MATALTALPNALSLARLPLAAVVWWVADRPWLFLSVLIVSALTDVIDGWLARKMRQRIIDIGKDPGRLGAPGGSGAWLDPLCDKLFVVSALVAVGWTYRPDPALVILIGARELVQVPLGLVYRLVIVPMYDHRIRFDFRAALAGKLTTVIQFVAVAAILFHSPFVPELAVAAAITGVLAVAYYVQRAILAAREAGRLEG